VTQEYYPKVSFIIPARNEAKFVEDCLQSLLSLDYPKEKVEILFAEGNSNDGTKEILEHYVKKHNNIKIFDNPTGNTAIGRNICIEHATGEMIMDFSAHAVAPKNLLKILVPKLVSQPDDVAGVGCSNVPPEKQNFVGKVSGAAFLGFMAGSGIFMQNTIFDEERFVEHMAFTLYRKEIFTKVGLFDPDFWCGQDAELDIRIKKAGYKILYTPKVMVKHYKRHTINALFQQMYRYGIARAKMIKKHPDTAKIFHLLPSFFIGGIIFLLLLWVFDIIPSLFLLFFGVLYSVLCFISTMRVSKNPLVILSSVFFYLLITTGYGLGFIRGTIYGKL